MLVVRLSIITCAANLTMKIATSVTNRSNFSSSGLKRAAQKA